MAVERADPGALGAKTYVEETLSNGGGLFLVNLTHQDLSYTCMLIGNELVGLTKSGTDLLDRIPEDDRIFD
ncbi:MAG: hypothetical protein AAF216_11990 [Pseudomonadota bacterium]